MAGFFGLINATSDGGGPLAAPRTLDTLLSVDKGDGAGAWLLSVFAGLAFPRAQVWGDVAAVGTHRRRLRESASSRPAPTADPSSAAPAPTSSGPAAGCSTPGPRTPTRTSTRSVRDSNVETLLIGGQLDFATPPQNATRELLPHLPNGHQVVLPNLGHADDFWAYEPRRVHPPDRHVPRHRPRRHVALHDQPASTSRRRSRTRRSPRSSSASSSASPRSSSSRSSGSAGGFAAARRSDGRRASPSGRCSRCCSASAAGASARWSS